MRSEILDSAQFRGTCGRFTTGVTVATVMAADGSPHGITVSSFTPVSLEPPLILICVDCRAQFVRHLPEGHKFGINMLEESQQGLSRQFSRKEAVRFSGIAWHTGKTGVPLLPSVLAIMECKLIQRVSAGDHFILVGQTLHASFYEGDPLTYFNGCYRKLLWEPWNARSQEGFGDGMDWSLII